MADGACRIFFRFASSSTAIKATVAIAPRLPCQVPRHCPAPDAEARRRTVSTAGAQLRRVGSSDTIVPFGSSPLVLSAYIPKSLCRCGRRAAAKFALITCNVVEYGSRRNAADYRFAQLAIGGQRVRRLARMVVDRIATPSTAHGHGTPRARCGCRRAVIHGT